MPPARLAIQVQTSFAEIDAVGRNESVARRAVSVAVNVDHRHSRRSGGLHRNRGRGRAGRDVDQRVDVLRKQVLDLIDLSRRVALGVDSDDLDSLRGAFGLDGFLDLVEEVRLKIGDCEADGLGFLGAGSERRKFGSGGDRSEKRSFANAHALLLLSHLTFGEHLFAGSSCFGPSGPRDPLRTSEQAVFAGDARTRRRILLKRACGAPCRRRPQSR